MDESLSALRVNSQHLRANDPAQRPHTGPDLREAGHPSDATPERCGAQWSFLPG